MAISAKTPDDEPMLEQMLADRLQCWANIEPALDHCLVFVVSTQLK